MKLFYSPGACSMAPHIVAREAGLDIQLEKVDLATQKTASGADFGTINSKGYVPVLQLDDGQFLTEGLVISQYLADKNPSAGLAPPANSMGRYRLQEMLVYINSELHKNFSPLFNPATGDAQRQALFPVLTKRFAYLDGVLGKHPYLLGDSFSAADAYLFTILGWAGHVKLDLSALKNLTSFLARVGARPAVQRALQEEGLLS